MKRTRSQKAITLVALIITIIVLLILAVVAIQAVQGDGIIAHAKNAKTSYAEASNNEASILESYQQQIAQETYNYAGLTIDENTPNASYNEDKTQVVYGDYTYTLNDDRWHVMKVGDTDKIEYGEICGTILGKKVTHMVSTFSSCRSLTQAPMIPNSVNYMNGTFSGCSSLKQAPIIPNSVISMNFTFRGCSSLTQAPIIPNSVNYMNGTFNGCSSLKQAPRIPNSVIYMQATFNGCTALKGEIEINANPSSFKQCFSNTKEEIWLKGISTKLSELAATSIAGNVKVK